MPGHLGDTESFVGDHMSFSGRHCANDSSLVGKGKYHHGLYIQAGPQSTLLVHCDMASLVGASLDERLSALYIGAIENTAGYLDAIEVVFDIEEVHPPVEFQGNDVYHGC